MPTTTIISNGSRFAGQPPATLPELLAVMAEHPISAHFRDILASNVPGRPGFVDFLGNFEDVSHVFHILTDDPDVCATMYAAIRANAARFGWTLPTTE